MKNALLQQHWAKPGCTACVFHLTSFVFLHGSCVSAVFNETKYYLKLKVCGFLKRNSGIIAFFLCVFKKFIFFGLYSLYFASFRCIKYSKMILFSSGWQSCASLLLLWGTEINKNTLKWSHHSVWLQRQGWRYDLVLILMDGCKLHLAVTAEELFPIAGRWKSEMATAGVGMSLGNPTVTISSMGPRAPDILSHCCKERQV